MYTLGIDAGMKTLKAVLSNGTDTRFRVLEGGNRSAITLAEKAVNELLEEAGIERKDVCNTIAIGSGKDAIAFKNGDCAESIALAAGMNALGIKINHVIDLGVRSCYMIRCNHGKVFNTVNGPRCAAGTGSFLDSLSVFLHLSYDEMNDMYFRSDSREVLQTRCVVFAESEVISLIHTGRKKEDIVRSIFRSFAKQVYGALLAGDSVDNLALVGGMANSPAFLDAFRELSGSQVLVPNHPQAVAALGAAMIAQKSVSFR